MLSKIIKYITIAKNLWYTFLFFCLSVWVISLVGVNPNSVPSGFLFWKISSFIIVSVSGLLLLIFLIGTIIIYAKEKKAKALKKLIFVPIRVIKAKSWNMIILLIIIAATSSIWLAFDYIQNNTLMNVGYVFDVIGISAIIAYLWTKISKSSLIK